MPEMSMYCIAEIGNVLSSKLLTETQVFKVISKHARNLASIIMLKVKNAAGL